MLIFVQRVCVEQTDKIFNHNDQVILALENNFYVTYPESNNATYKSLVNYATDLNSPIQRWYRYKEGYSIKLMERLFKDNNVAPGDIILDPFCGSGSTIVQAKENGLGSYGFEINPFSYFLAKAKTQNYTQEDLLYFEQEKSRLLSIGKGRGIVQKPKLSTIDKLYPEEVLKYLLTMREEIKKIEGSKVKDLYMLAWFSILEESSNYRKAGNGLKIRRGKTIKAPDLDFVLDLFRQKVVNISEDLPYAVSISNVNTDPKLFECTSLEMDKYVESGIITGVLFSPPYANCFDYTEIYKVELWMGEFVKDYPDIKVLRRRGIRSNLNANLKKESMITSTLSELNDLVELLGQVTLWDKKIPIMVMAYFEDMFKSLDKIYLSLKKGGFCAIVVSNSAYGGIIVPTDLLLAKYAEQIGFKTEKIEVARYIITSSQQYNKTKDHKRFLRESIIHLRKS